MSAPPPRRRFRVDSIVPDADGRVDLGPVRRHLEVLRAAIGDSIRLFDGRGGEVIAEIAVLDAATAAARVASTLDNDAESPLTITFVQALPARAKRMDLIVRQVTELGVDRIVPVLAERSQWGNPEAEALERRAERWRRIATAAAEQSGRAKVPEIERPVPFEKLAWEAVDGKLLIADPGGAPLAAQDPAPRAVGVMVGPEGGWSAAEVATAGEYGAEPFGLGPRVLRADTAGAVVVAMLQSRWGDLR